MTWTVKQFDWWAPYAESFARRHATFKRLLSIPNSQKTDPWLLPQCEATRGAAQNPPKLSMPGSYTAPELHVTQAHPENVYPLKTLQAIHKDLPIKGRSILSNAAQFEERIAKQKNYYVALADDQALSDTTNFEDLLMPHIHNTHVIEFGASLSTKTARIYANLREHNGNFASYTHNDIVAEDFSIAAKNMTDAGLSRRKMRQVVGNFLEEETWEKIFTAKLLKSELPITVLFLGATICNFTPEELDIFLTLLQKYLRPNDKAIISVDCTLDLETLKKAYNHYYYKHFFVNAYMHFRRKLGLRYSEAEKQTIDICYNVTANPFANVKCRIEFDQKSAHETEIRMMISDKVFVPSEAGSSKFIWMKIEMVAGLMRKLSPELFGHIFRDYGFRVLPGLYAKLPQPQFKKVHCSLFVVQA